MTHSARDVRAGGPLAVGPRGAGAADFLLLAQQLAMLLLPVLHVDEQRDEAVLHLRGKKKKSQHSQHVRLSSRWQDYNSLVPPCLQPAVKKSFALIRANSPGEQSARL